MGKVTFKGGIHPDYSKLSAEQSIITMDIPPLLYVPLSQHAGKPAQPLVKRGDTVLKGQLIGQANGFISANIHAPTSGRVKQLTSYPHPVFGTMTETIVIEADGKDEWHPDIQENQNWQQTSPSEIVNAIKNAGIVGLGGAAFPTHVKLSPPPEKPIDTIIINGAECEPYLTGDDRLMREQPDNIVNGAILIKKAVNAKKIIIAIEDNKKQSIQKITEAIGTKQDITVAVAKTKYPEGGEKQLIKAVLNREVPSGGLPMDVGVVVQNVGTTIAVYKAIRYRQPLIERVLTLSGDLIKKPSNFLVRIGTPFKFILEKANETVTDAFKIIMGGPMMGIAQYTVDVPVIKGTSGILFMSEQTAKIYEPYPCIRCGKCVDVCPMRLMPLMLVDFIKSEKFEDARNIGLLDCIECGSCTYICPSHIRHVQLIKYAKQELRRMK